MCLFQKTTSITSPMTQICDASRRLCEEVRITTDIIVQLTVSKRPQSPGI